MLLLCQLALLRACEAPGASVDEELLLEVVAAVGAGAKAFAAECLPSPSVAAATAAVTPSSGCAASGWLLEAACLELLRLCECSHLCVTPPHAGGGSELGGATTTSGQRSAKQLIFPPDGWRLCT
jgi:hypothetical protein